MNGELGSAEVSIDVKEKTPSASENFLGGQIPRFQEYSRVDICRVKQVSELNGQNIVYFRIISRSDSGFSDRIENSMLEANIMTGTELPDEGSMGVVVSVYGSGTANDRYIYLGTIQKGKKSQAQDFGVGEKGAGDFTVSKNKASLIIPNDSNFVSLSNSNVGLSLDKDTISLGDKLGGFGLDISPNGFSVETTTKDAGISGTDSGLLIKSKGDITIATDGAINFISKKTRKKTVGQLANGSNSLPDESSPSDNVQGFPGKYELAAGTYRLKVLSKNIAEFNPLINPISPDPSYVVDILEGGAEFSIGSGSYVINLLNSAPFIGSGFEVNIGTIPFLNSSEMLLETGVFEVSVSAIPGLLGAVAAIELSATTAPSAEIGVYMVGPIMTSGMKASVSSATLQTSMGLSKIEVETSGIKIQGSAPVKMEKTVLGESLVDELKDMLDAISSLTVPTALGPSGPPLNSVKFKIQKATIKLKVLSLFNKNN